MPIELKLKSGNVKIDDNGDITYSGNWGGVNTNIEYLLTDKSYELALLEFQRIFKAMGCHDNFFHFIQDGQFALSRKDFLRVLSLVKDGEWTEEIRRFYFKLQEEARNRT